MRKKLPNQFLNNIRRLQEAYLSHSDPIKQSGFYGGKAQWKSEREIILNAVEKDGDFLDVGCANGYLLECLVDWAKAKGITIEAYGVDIGANLIALAKERFPNHGDHFWTANAWDWVPPRKFDYVYTLSDNVPEPFIRDYLFRLLRHYVNPDGVLIVGAYGSYSKNQPAYNVAKALTDAGLIVAGQAACGELPVTHIAWTGNVSGAMDE
ncbi:MAG: class I SAM-dependent methyltransferase [Armatimonadota bacterium]